MWNIKLSCFIQCLYKGVKILMTHIGKKWLMMQWQDKNIKVELREQLQSIIEKHCQVSNTW